MESKRNKTFGMIAKTMAGLEDVLAEELIKLGANNVEKGIRMVSFEGDLTLMYKANICCRTALKILKPIHTFKANSTDEIYEEMKSFDWGNYLTEKDSFAIDAVVFSKIFTHSKFITYRVKDSIVDYFTEKTGKRPSVSVTNPDLYINIHVAHNRCTLSLDSSGESLHKRGYRVAQTDAPISEVLAAGMILKSGWKGDSVFIDPMCGSGTILIEAALIALNISPGIYRESFAFEKWKDFDKELFEEIIHDDSQEKEFKYKLYGSDISTQAIAIAKENVENAGLKRYIELEVKPIQQYKEAPAPSGIIITNPPYGERLTPNNISDLYDAIGERLKHVFMGYTAWIISSKREYLHKIGLKPSEKYQLINGALDCEYYKYEIFAGKKKDINDKRRKHHNHN